MKTKLFYVFAFILVVIRTEAQTPPGGFGGFYEFEQQEADNISETQRQEIIQQLQRNTARLTAQGLLQKKFTTTQVKFGWPVRQASGYNDPGFYGTRFFVDQDFAYPNHVLDYNCGSRTYDDNTGYNHRGTDIVTFPFGWTKMKENAVEAIAAADGIIIGKADDNPDTNCVRCTDCKWNAVYVQNDADGTVSWYLHLKKGSLTTKPVGAAVKRGEYLGVVGSSGPSAVPHLHFEVWRDTKYDWLIDPWEGSCNQDKNESYWETQDPYYVPSMIKVASTYGIPDVYSCYMNGEGENPKYKDTFTIGETVYLPVFYRDNIPGEIIHLKLITPGNTVLYDWTLYSHVNYHDLDWFYYYWGQSVFNTPGKWTFWVQYGNNSAEHSFYLQEALPLKLLSFTGTAKNSTTELKWTTTNEVNVDRFAIQRSTDGVNFTDIQTQAATGNDAGAVLNNYNYTDVKTLNGVNYYRLKMVDKDGKYQYSNVVLINIVKNAKGDIVLLGNPVGNNLVYFVNSDLGSCYLKIADANGRIVSAQKQELLKNQNGGINVSGILRGNYFLIIDAASQHITIPFVKE